MNEPSQPPKRRRRRIIAGVALVVVSLVVWWQWPRGDQTLVGRWRIVFPNWNTQKENKTPVRQYVLTLRRNGYGSLRREDIRAEDRFRWSYDGQTLVLGEESPARYGSKTLQVASWAYGKLTGHGWLLAPLILKVKDSGRHAVTFDEAHSKTPWTIDFRPIVPSVMTRIPD